jgi:uncharacterized membrane protein
MRYVVAVAVGLLAAWLLEPGAFVLGALLGYVFWAQREQHHLLVALREDVRRGSAPSEARETSIAAEPSEAQPLRDAQAASEEEPSGKEEREVPAPAAGVGTTAPRRDRPPATTEPLSTSRVPGLLQRVRQVVLGGNPLVRIGIVVLFFGFAFLVKYAVDNDYFPIELRLALTALAGLVLVAIGWRLRERRADVGLALQGGGIAILYLSVFAAFRLYALVPSSAAFILLVLTAALGAAIAILQNAQSLAILALLGGFFAPVLATTGEGSHVALFSYYLVLNAAVVVIAWFKPWRPMNLVGFFCTFGIAGLWVSQSFEPALFATTEPFLLLFFLLYFGVSLLHARHRRPDVKDVVDGTLVFGLPVAVLSIQAVLVNPYPFGLAWSAFGFGVFYALAAWALYRRAPETIRMLVEAFAGIGLALGTMVLPFAVDAAWTSAGWALEGGALVWLGLRQRRRLVRLGGWALQLAAGVALLTVLEDYGQLPAVFNRFYMSMLALSLAALFSAYLTQRHRERLASWEVPLEGVFLAIGMAWWLLGGTGEVVHVLDDIDGELAFQGVVAFVALTALGATGGSVTLEWRALRIPALLVVPVLTLLLTLGALGLDHPFEAGGLVAWPLGLVAHYVALRTFETGLAPGIRRLLHASGLWLVFLLGVWEAFWGFGQLAPADTVWPKLAWGAVGVLLLALVIGGARRTGWPLGVRRVAYLRLGAMPLLVVLFGWSLWLSLTSAADPAPLAYLPLLNPADVLLGASALVGVLWYRTARKTLDAFGGPRQRRLLLWGLTGAAFLALNATLARTVHVWGGVPYDLETLLDATAFQTALTIFWTALSVTTMAVAARRGGRTPWIVAAVLLGITVIKLFAVDLSSIGTVARIATFLVVGVLLLLVGYLAPVPPERAAPSDVEPVDPSPSTV